MRGFPDIIDITAVFGFFSLVSGSVFTVSVQVHLHFLTIPYSCAIPLFDKRAADRL